MNKFALSLASLSVLALPGLAADAPPSPPSVPAAAPNYLPDADAAGYAYGVSFGIQIYNLGVSKDVPPEAIMRGLRDGMNGKRTGLAEISTVQQFVKEVEDRDVERNHAAAQDFLAQNGAKKGVRRTVSGVQYEVLSAGDKRGASPGANDSITVNYTGKLLDGTEFDHGEGTKLSLATLIKGWQETLPLMKPGSKWRLYVPPELAYGDKSKPRIPAGSLLVFEIELVSVGDKPAA
jgi:FKBP-type peptidyl-prolyl cis-trans isomerase